jgi:hypothetical protein
MSYEPMPEIFNHDYDTDYKRPVEEAVRRVQSEDAVLRVSENRLADADTVSVRSAVSDASAVSAPITVRSQSPELPAAARALVNHRAFELSAFDDRKLVRKPGGRVVLATAAEVMDVREAAIA